MSTEILRQALEKIARVNACDYEYQAWAREALNHSEDNLHMVKQERPQNCGTSYCSCIECVMNEQEQGKPVLEVINGQINRAWDAIPNGFTGLLYMQPHLTAPPKKPQEPWHGSARVDDYNRGWNECIDSINTTPQPKQEQGEVQHEKK